MVLVDVLNFAVCAFVDCVVEEIYDGVADRHRRDYHERDIRRQLARAHHFDGLAHEVEANDGEHYARGERQQKTDDFIRLAAQHRADDSAEPRAAHARYKGYNDDCEIVHSFAFVRRIARAPLIIINQNREKRKRARLGARINGKNYVRFQRISNAEDKRVGLSCLIISRYICISKRKGRGVCRIL